ncbi:MAG: PKD domain-containing protein [Saprospiraceae bacterium]|nr:PKD domain-containing protein [Saprospiraceae bacterium]
MRTLFILFLSLITSFLLAQTTVEREADFTVRYDTPYIIFTPILPPLVQIAGAPATYYEYYWEFGDGTFSLAENPSHVYKDTIEHEVYLLATGKYDNGKAPKSRKKKVDGSKEPPKTIMASAQPVPAVLEEASATIGLRAIRNPRAEEELVCILAYKNQTPITQSGKLYLFYNQKSYKNEHFTFQEARKHYGEREEQDIITYINNKPDININGWTSLNNISNWYDISLPDQDPNAALNNLKTIYKNSKSWSFNGLQVGEERNLFISLHATNEMLADTNAIIRMTGLFISDDQRIVEEYTLEMEIVASHDPNYIAVSQRRMNFRRIRNKDLEYKVHFQNNGEGPASTVQITCDVPNGLNMIELEVIDLYPTCLLCPDQPVTWSCLDTSFQEDQIIFTFKNIYLPGTRQEGVNDRDSTKGFVKYRLIPHKKIRKLSLDTRASIVFDKNPPIITNRTATHFKPGISPGIMTGLNIFPDNPKQNYYNIGVSLAPFKPYKRFFQIELWTGFPSASITQENTFQDSTSIWERIQGTIIVVDSVYTTMQQTTQNPLYFNVIPLQIRKNFIDWLSSGVGIMLNIELQRNEITEQVLLERKVYRSPEPTIDIPREQMQPLTDLFTRQTSTSSNNVKDWLFHAAFFADFQLGMVRQGPALGLRGVLPLEKERNWYVSLFASWKL